MSRISVLIPDADDWIGLRVAYCLNSAGEVSVHGLSRRESWPFRLSNLFRSFDHSGEFELSSWLARIDEIVARRGVDVVLPVSSFGIRALSEHGSMLGCADRLVHLPEPHVFDEATNKSALADVLTASGIPQPTTVVVAAGAPRPEGLSSLTFPVLAKPPLAGSGDGIRRFESPKELDLFLASEGWDHDWVVQEFIEGSDLCANVLCQNGQIIASTVQHAIAPSSVPFAPAPTVEFIPDSSAMSVVAKLIERLHWSGVAHIDMRLGAQDEAPRVLELNGRYWLSVLGSLQAGVNFPILACEAVLGLPKSNRRAQSTRYFSGKSWAVSSLFGGGRYRVRPWETDLSYYVCDPLLFACSLVGKPVKTLRDKLSGQMRPPRGSDVDGAGNGLKGVASELYF
jgi:hypothetical protein